MPELTPMPTVTTTPAARPSGAARNAQGTDKSSNDATQDAQTQPFAAVLRGKCAAQPPAKDPKADSKAKGDAKGDGNSDTDDAASGTALPALAPQAPSNDALFAAARLPLPAQLKAAASAATALAGIPGKGALTGQAGPRTGLALGDADRDAGRALAAGVADPPGTFGAAALAAGMKAGAAALAAGATSLSAQAGLDGLPATGHRGGTAGDAGNSSSTDNSTLAMLMPNQNANPVQSGNAVRPTSLIEAPVGSALFADEAAQRVTWMAKNGIEHAEIRVTPPDMGPIQVSIDMHHNEASINFVVTQTDTRVALEDSLHRLEEMLAESGISLAQANVGQRDAGQSQQGNGRGASGNDSGGTSRASLGASSAVLSVATSRGSTAMRGLVDTFA